MDLTVSQPVTGAVYSRLSMLFASAVNDHNDLEPCCFLQ